MQQQISFFTGKVEAKQKKKDSIIHMHQLNLFFTGKGEAKKNKEKKKKTNTC